MSNNFYGLLAKDEQKLELNAAHPLNSHINNIKKKGVIISIKICWSKSSYSFDVIIASTLKDTQS